MKKNTLLIVILFIIPLKIIFSQALPIAMDGIFDDWDEGYNNYTDTQSDGAGFDLLSFSVSNDSTNLYVRFVLDKEIQLNYGNNLYLEIDADNNPSTGYSINGIGVELAIKFGDKKIYYNTASGSTVYPAPSDIDFYVLPTVTSDTFEISIGRDVLPDGVHQLFTSNTIKFFFADFNNGGDYMPDAGTFEYTFDNSSIEEYQIINIEKENDNDVRLMTYNTLWDGLISTSTRIDAFKRITTAVNPDIITFNECWDTGYSTARDLLNDWLPIQNGGTWKCYKIDAGNITCSKYDITDNYVVLQGSRITASIIDLPSHPRDIIIINSHFKAGGSSSDNDKRQDEADAIINFIREVKTSGGAITMPYGTPYVISGDLNLVGNSQQLTTLITGDIIDEATFGKDIKPDWDDTNLNDIISYHTNERVAYTWTEENNLFWPGRLDYAICSDIGASVRKAFTIHTPKMTEEDLSKYGLNSDDTNIASDHLPKVTDFIIENAVQSINDISNLSKILVYPNPSLSGVFTISNKSCIIRSVDIYNVLGQKVNSIYEINTLKYNLDLSSFNSGIYYLKIKGDAYEDDLKIIKL